MARTYKDQRKFNQKQAIRSGFVDVSYDEEMFDSHKELMRLKSEKVSKTLKDLSRLWQSENRPKGSTRPPGALPYLHQFIPEPLMTSTIATASIEAFLLENYAVQLQDIAENGCSGGTITELIYHYDIDAFYAEHKTQIDAIVEEVFYECYEGQPEEWFKNAKRLGFDIVNLDDARRFYTYLAVEVKAQELNENF